MHICHLSPEWSGGGPQRLSDGQCPPVTFPGERLRCASFLRPLYGDEMLSQGTLAPTLESAGRRASPRISRRTPCRRSADSARGCSPRRSPAWSGASVLSSGPRNGCGLSLLQRAETGAESAGHLRGAAQAPGVDGGDVPTFVEDAVGPHPCLVSDDAAGSAAAPLDLCSDLRLGRGPVVVAPSAVITTRPSAAERWCRMWAAVPAREKRSVRWRRAGPRTPDPACEVS